MVGQNGYVETAEDEPIKFTVKGTCVLSDTGRSVQNLVRLALRVYCVTDDSIEDMS